MPIAKPPPHPWIFRPASAFNPDRAWFPEPFVRGYREFVEGADAAFTAGVSWSDDKDVGPVPLFSGTGSAYSAKPLAAPAGGWPGMTITFAYQRSAGATANYPILGGWGGGQTGYGHTPTTFGINSYSGAIINPITLAFPVGAWRVITIRLGGVIAGSRLRYDADGRPFPAQTLANTLAAPDGAGFRIGASFNANSFWQGPIAFTLLHRRELADHEVRALHEDFWRSFRDFRSEIARRIAMIPPPFQVGGAGLIAPAVAAGRLEHQFKFGGMGTIAPAFASGSINRVWTFGGKGLIAPAHAVGHLGAVPSEAIAAIVAYATGNPELAASVSALRWERAPEKAEAPYATVRMIATQWGPHSELGGVEQGLVELKFTHTSADKAMALARAWTRGPNGLDRAVLPFGDGGLLTLLRETAPLPLPPPASTDKAGNQLRAVVVQYRALIERY